jgi:hypothetical protein
MPNLDYTRQTRQNFTGLLNNLSTEEANYIPAGYSNNIIWNYAHNIVTQQLLTYGLSGLELSLPKPMVDAFRKGSRPEKVYTKAEIEQFKQLSLSTLDQFEADLSAGKFDTFKVYPTSFGITLETLEQAATFNAMHEALHLGYAMSLRKAVKG